jgi:hypothetical protein
VEREVEPLIYIGVDLGGRRIIKKRETDDPRFAVKRRAFLVRSKESLVEARALHMAMQIVDELPVREGERPMAIGCVEFPRFYGTAKSKGDPNDLLDLASVAGAVLGALSERLFLMPSAPYPRTWKGSTPKSMQNHVWDACGLLEWIKSKTQNGMD